MAKAIQQSSTQFTHDDVITLLSEVWASQFIYRARRELREVAESFFVEAVQLKDDLSSAAAFVPARKGALGQHQVASTDRRATLGPPLQTPTNSYVTLKGQQGATPLGAARDQFDDGGAGKTNACNGDPK